MERIAQSSLQITAIVNGAISLWQRMAVIILQPPMQHA